VPGVRENGGQYTHAAIWVMMAFAKRGDGNKAFEIFKMLNPILHTENSSDVNEYKDEPYVIAADVYSGNNHDGRGGWSWYTGSASWYYRAGLESILGFDLKGNQLKLKPCIPSEWHSYEISYLYGQTQYMIQVKNPKGLCSGKVAYELDGVLSQAAEVTLVDDKSPHKVLATISVL
jgi:cellobiose phosphorylase